MVTQWFGKPKANGKTTSAFLVLELKAIVLLVSCVTLNNFPHKVPIKGIRLKSKYK